MTTFKKKKNEYGDNESNETVIVEATTLTGYIKFCKTKENKH